MKIACLCWGSLFWNPKELKIQKDSDGNNIWYEDGPFLPIEFTRISGDDNVTLIIDDKAKPIQVMWALFETNDIDTAREMLRKRERTIIDNIHFAIAEEKVDDKIKSTIIQWIKTKEIDMAIWTGLSYSSKTENKRPTAEEIIRHLKNLPEEGKIVAEKYIRKAPKQIQTEYRKRIEEELGWTPT